MAPSRPRIYSTNKGGRDDREIAPDTRPWAATVEAGSERYRAGHEGLSAGELARLAMGPVAPMVTSRALAATAATPGPGVCATVRGRDHPCSGSDRRACRNACSSRAGDRGAGRRWRRVRSGCGRAAVSVRVRHMGLAWASSLYADTSTGTAARIPCVNCAKPAAVGKITLISISGHTPAHPLWKSVFWSAARQKTSLPQFSLSGPPQTSGSTASTGPKSTFASRRNLSCATNGDSGLTHFGREPPR